MRLSRVYVEDLPEPGSTLALPKEISHYVGNVLRLREGDELLLFNGERGEFLARIDSVSKRSVQVALTERRRAPDDSAFEGELSITLLLGLSRGDRMDLAVQKSTELGVREIVPIYTEYGEVRLKGDRAEKKLQHWRRIAISACEQCGRLTVPTIQSPLALTDVSPGDGENRWMLEPSGTDTLPSSIAEKSIQLLIGPEGGFSPAEIDWAVENGFRIVALGRRVLRTETAPIAALAIVQHNFGDMQ